MNKLPFVAECYFCFDAPTPSPEPVIHATFNSQTQEEAFLCQEHLNRAEALNQLTEVRTVMTGITRILKRYEE